MRKKKRNEILFIFHDAVDDDDGTQNNIQRIKK